MMLFQCGKRNKVVQRYVNGKGFSVAGFSRLYRSKVLVFTFAFIQLNLKGIQDSLLCDVKHCLVELLTQEKGFDSKLRKPCVLFLCWSIDSHKQRTYRNMTKLTIKHMILEKTKQYFSIGRLTCLKCPLDAETTGPQCSVSLTNDLKQFFSSLNVSVYMKQKSVMLKETKSS